MMGLIFEAVREFIVDRHGEDTWDDLLEGAGVEGAYTRLGNYPHSELSSLIQAAARRFGQSPDEVWRTSGRAAFRRLRDHLPTRVDRHKNSQELFQNLQGTIHRRVADIYPDTSPPRFDTQEKENGDVLLSYFSHRGLCHLAEGLAMGAIDYFQQAATVVQTQCGRDSDAPCQIRISYL